MMMTSTQDPTAAWQEGALFKGSYEIEYAINTAQPYQFQEWRDQLIERGALGSPWRQAVQGIGLPLEAADHVAHYVRSRDRVHNSLYDLLEKDDTALDTANQQYRTRRENLRLFFVARMTELGLTPEAAGHLITLYRAWERGQSHGVDSATAHVQDCLKKKPTSMTLLRFWFSWLGVLPVGKAGGVDKKKKPTASPDEPPADDAPPLPNLAEFQSDARPRPGATLLRGPFNPLGVDPDPTHPDASTLPHPPLPDAYSRLQNTSDDHTGGDGFDSFDDDSDGPPTPWDRL